MAELNFTHCFDVIVGSFKTARNIPLFHRLYVKGKVWAFLEDRFIVPGEHRSAEMISHNYRLGDLNR